MKKPTTHCGFVAIIGRPNVGKSTLLNRILGKKVSIVTPKPQTTRHRILGIKTVDGSQTIYMDTPGLHKIAKCALNRYMNRAATAVIHDADVIVFMTEALVWHEEDEWILHKLKQVQCPVICAVNKIDKVRSKEKLLPYLQKLSEHFSFADIVPISADKGKNVKELEKTIAKYLPENDFIFPEDQVTDKSDQFLVAEIIREKLMRIMQQEVPYALTVEIEQFVYKDRVLHITALIWVEKPGQKIIVIGSGGENLKQIGKEARLELERWFDCKIFLKLWVKVKSSWADDERILKKLGYEL